MTENSQSILRPPRLVVDTVLYESRPFVVTAERADELLKSHFKDMGEVKVGQKIGSEDRGKWLYFYNPNGTDEWNGFPADKKRGQVGE